MSDRSPAKLIFCICALAIMVGFIAVLGMLLHDALPSNKAATVSSSSSSTTNSSRLGPYTLGRTYTDVGKTLYTSFEVYAPAAKAGEKADLVYRCGRLFESLDVKSIAWAKEENYDIVVTMKDGTVHLFGFDGNAGWQ